MLYRLNGQRKTKVQEQFMTSLHNASPKQKDELLWLVWSKLRGQYTVVMSEYVQDTCEVYNIVSHYEH